MYFFVYLLLRSFIVAGAMTAATGLALQALVCAVSVDGGGAVQPVFAALPVPTSGAKDREKCSPVIRYTVGRIDSPWRSVVSAAEDSDRQPLRSSLVAAHIVYGLHALAIGLGIVGSSTVIGGFVGSLPSMLAVIISYVKRGGARDSWAASHFRWQIRTFWFALLWLLVATLLLVTLVGVPVGLGLLAGVTLWLIYRIARGWLRLLDRQPMYG